MLALPLRPARSRYHLPLTMKISKLALLPLLMSLMCVAAKAAPSALPTLEYTFQHEEFLSYPQSVTFSPDGKTVASAGREGIILWNISTGKRGRTLGLPTPKDRNASRTLAFSPDGKTLAEGISFFGQTNQLQLWDVATGQQKRILWRDDRRASWVRDVTFSPDGKIIAAAIRWETALQNKNHAFVGAILLWDARTGKRIERLTRYQKIFSRTLQTDPATLSFSRDGQHILSCDIQPVLWNVATQKVTRIFTQITAEKGAAGVAGAALAPAQNIVVGWSPFGKVALRQWNADSGKLLRAVPVEQKFGLQCGAFSPDGTLFVGGAGANAEPGALYFWQMPLAKSSGVLRHKEMDGVAALAFSPDGQRLASASLDGAVRIWRWN